MSEGLKKRKNVTIRGLGFILLNMCLFSMIFSPMATCEEELEIYFMVGLADVSVGYNVLSEQVEPVTGEEYADGLYVDGRLALYLKGKIKGKYLLTAQLDTGEISSWQQNDGFWRGSAVVLRQLNPEKYYPVYGDQSSLETDVSTWGKLYLLLEWDQSDVLWGTYTAGMTESDWIVYNRNLYGFKSNFRDDFSDLQLYWAEPGTLRAIDRIKSTGSSLYYLSHAQMIRDTEQLKLEVRDPLTGEVAEMIILERGRDYTLDPYAGRVTLLRTLRDLTSDTYLFDINLTGTGQIFLLAEYEYDARGTALNDTNRGVKLIHNWTDQGQYQGNFVGSYVKDLREDGKQYELYGIDLTYTFLKNTYIELDWAGSKNTPGVVNYSDWGGLVFSTLPTADPETPKNAVSLRTSLEIPEPTDQLKNLTITGLYQFKEKGFATVSEQAGVESNYTQIRMNGETVEGIEFTGTVTAKHEIGGQTIHLTSLQTSKDLSLKHKLVGLIRHQSGTHSGGQSLADTLGGLRWDYQYNDTKRFYVSDQFSIYRNAVTPKNNRFAVGTELAWKGYTVNADLSKGNLGDILQASVEYQMTEQDSLSARFVRETDSAGGKTHRLFYRIHGQVDPDTVMYFEHQDLLGTYDQGIIFAGGMEYIPVQNGLIGLELATGKLERMKEKPASKYFPDPTNDLFAQIPPIESGFYNKTALTARVSYIDEDVDYRTNFQLSTINGGILQCIFRNGFNWDLEQGLVLKMGLDGSLTYDIKGKEDQERKLEGNIAIAYRPVFSDRLNFLGKYTYLEQLSVKDQQDGTDPDERSHIFTVEGIYDLNKYLQFNEKIGYRQSSMRQDRAEGEWMRSDTILAVNRLGYKFYPDWQVYGEVRGLWNILADDRKLGGLLGVEWTFRNDTRLGFGYNFADFNDDLTNLNYNARGFFLNIASIW